MKCSNCNSEIPEDKEFLADGGLCQKCQAAAKKYCPECGTECGFIDKFCEECGHKFTKEDMPAPQDTLQPPLEPAPKPSAPKGAEEEAFLKHVTVLIVDMKGSTELIGKMDPEEARETLFPAMQKLSSIVYEYGGTVISTAGDGLIAIFGMTQTLENHAMRACLAALAMQRQIKQINQAFLLRIGLNTGEILISVDKSKYDIVGPVVHLAARMEQLAKPGTIQLTRNTLKQVEDNVTVESVGNLEAKGFSELIETFELKGVKVRKSLTELENQFLEKAGFVNREEELKQIESLLLAAKAGQGNSVSLCAETGIGKSRFTYELIKSNSAKDCNVLLTAGFIHLKNIPLLPIKNLFLNLFGILKNENVLENIKTQIKPFLAKIDSPYALNATLNLIQLLPEDPEWNTLEPGLKRKFMFEVGAQILSNYASEKPLILIFEDMHWIDSISELFLDLLTSQVGKWKTLIIITFRPEFHDHWVNKPNYTKIILNPLTNKACSTMLDNILGTDPSLAEIKTKLLTSAEGNPFFLEELALSLINEKIFVGKQNNYRLREGTVVTEIHLPESIASIYETKIDSLRPIEKKILQIASVIGAKFLYHQLVQLMGVIDEGEVRMSLNRLADNQYIYETQLYPELGFAFTHTLTLDTAYNSMLKKTRKALHQRLFQILESSLTEEHGEQAQIFAEHASLGEDWEKAFYYYVKSAERVYEINAFTASAQLYEKALIMAAHLPQNEETILKKMKIHYALYYVYVPLGRFKEQQEHLDKALEIALAKKDLFFQSLIHSAICIHYMGYKNVNEAFQHAEKAYQIAKELHSKDAIAIAQFSLVNVHYFLGQFEEILLSYRELEETAGNPDFRSEWLKLPICQLAHSYESWTLSFTGQFSVVEERKEKWFAESKNLSLPSIGNVCRFGSMGMNYYIKGEFEKALEYTLTALHYSLAAEVIIFVPVFLGLLSNMYLRLNKIPEGKEYLAKAIAATEKISASYISSPSMVTISECLLLVGDVEKAKEFCSMAIKIVLERQVQPLYGLLLRVSAEIDLAMPNPNYEEIKRKLEEALEILSKMKMWAFVGRSHLSLAKLYQKMGDIENKNKQIILTLDYFEKFKMTYWAEQTRALASNGEQIKKAM